MGERRLRTMRPCTRCSVRSLWWALPSALDRDQACWILLGAVERVSVSGGDLRVCVTQHRLHLAEVGLYDEARWALVRANSIAPSSEATDALVQVLQHSGQDVEAARLANPYAPVMSSARNTP